ncbi:GVQW3 protein, partial [Acromyrmex charruanus]
MEKTNFRSAVIKHLHMKGLTPKKIKTELDNLHSTSTPFATVYNWVNEFKRGRISTCDAPRSGRLIEAATSEIIDKIHNIVLTNRRVKVRELVEATGISHGTVISILYEQLGMKKLSRWVPRLLTVDAILTLKKRTDRAIRAVDYPSSLMLQELQIELVKLRDDNVKLSLYDKCLYIMKPSTVLFMNELEQYAEHVYKIYDKNSYIECELTVYAVEITLYIMHYMKTK